MAEWKSLDVLICEYAEAQRRLEEAIRHNRAPGSPEPQHCPADEARPCV